LSGLKILGSVPGFGDGRHKVVCSWLRGKSTYALT
jgi:hypothetical protein